MAFDVVCHVILFDFSVSFIFCVIICYWLLKAFNYLVLN